jgi:hypothetical protein
VCPANTAIYYLLHGRNPNKFLSGANHMGSYGWDQLIYSDNDQGRLYYAIQQQMEPTRTIEKQHATHRQQRKLPSRNIFKRHLSENVKPLETSILNEVSYIYTISLAVRVRSPEA